MKGPGSLPALGKRPGCMSLLPCSPSEDDKGHCAHPGSLTDTLIMHLMSALPTDTGREHETTTIQNKLSVKMWLILSHLKRWWLVSMERAFQEKLCTPSFLCSHVENMQTYIHAYSLDTHMCLTWRWSLHKFLSNCSCCTCLTWKACQFPNFSPQTPPNNESDLKTVN